MRSNFKGLFLIVSIVCFFVAAMATPGAIGYAVYEWAIADIELKLALWEGVKYWIMAFSMVVPGFILLTLS